MNLFFDIETIPDQRSDALDRAREATKAPANYKKQEAIDKYKDEKAVETHAKTGLNGLYGEICSIGWAIEDFEAQAITRTHEMTEVELLTKFYASVMASSEVTKTNYPAFKWIGHNVIDFDLRFLKQRCLVNDVKPPFIIPADARHGSAAFDTMKEWGGWKGYVKLDELLIAFGLGSKGDIDGSMVAGLWADQQYDTINIYNISDVQKTRMIYNRMVWK